MGRVLNRADSLGLHRVQSDSFPFSAESSFRQLDDVFLQTQTRVWLGEVLKTRLEEETSIADLLADGIILCEVSTVIWKMLLTKFMKLRSSKPSFSRSSSRKNSGRYMPYSNVDAFLKICQMLGLTGIDLFSPSDVVEKRDIRRVCMCIRSLSKHARFKNLNVPDFDVVTCTVAMPTDMVKGIRCSLEQSRFKFSQDSAGCITHLSSRPKYGQKNWGADFARQYDSYSEESDNIDSNYQVVGFDSPTSTTSCGGPSLLNSDLENSPRGSFVVDSCTTSYLYGFHTDSDESAGSSEHGKGYVFDLHRESDFHGPDSVCKTKVYQLGKNFFEEIEDADTACSDYGKADTTDDEDEFDGKVGVTNLNIRFPQHNKRAEHLHPANRSTLNTDKLQFHKESQLSIISNDGKGPEASGILTPRSVSACYICQSPTSVSRDDGRIKCTDCAIDDLKVSGFSSKAANGNVKENLLSGDFSSTTIESTSQGLNAKATVLKAKEENFSCSVASTLRVVIADDYVRHHSGGVVLDPCIQSLENHPFNMPTCSEDGREAEIDQVKPSHQAWTNHEDVASSTENLDKVVCPSLVCFYYSFKSGGQMVERKSWRQLYHNPYKLERQVRRKFREKVENREINMMGFILLKSSGSRTRR